MGKALSLKKPVIIALGGIALLLILGVITLVGFRLITGRSLGIKSFVTFRLRTVKAIIDSKNVKSGSTGEFKNVIFLHLSTGNNLIEQGNVRELFQHAGIDFWDHGYNYQGLRDPQGEYRHYSYYIPGDNTTPEGLKGIFTQKRYGWPVNVFSGLLQHEVILIKSCFTPANHITSDEQLDQYKSWYLEIRKVMDQHPEKLFIILTAPPLNPAETNAGEATRARAFANWLKSGEFLEGHSNIYTFDFYGYLAEGDPASVEVNMLRAGYREGADSHPNRLANQTIGPILVDFVLEKIQVYRSVEKAE